jgi:hypothetical protein
VGAPERRWQANLAIINLQTGHQGIFQLGTGPQGGGYDDIDFNNNAVYLSASAPTSSRNTAPAIVALQASRKGVVLTRILNGDATATNVTISAHRDAESPGPRLDDPGSARELVMTSQGDGELVIVQRLRSVPRGRLLLSRVPSAEGLTESVEAPEPAILVENDRTRVRDKQTVQFSRKVHGGIRAPRSPALRYVQKLPAR